MRASKQNKGDEFDGELMNVLKDMNNTTKSLNSEPENEAKAIADSENMLFCKSLVPTLDRLNQRDAAYANMEIQKVLFNIEFRE